MVLCLCPAGFTGPAGGPKDFDILIHLATPFVYDPAEWPICSWTSGNFTGGVTTRFDAVITAGDAVSRIATVDSGVNSPTADAGTPWVWSRNSYPLRTGQPRLPTLRHPRPSGSSSTAFASGRKFR